MKKIIFLILVFASITFWGCSKEDDDKFTFTPECLASTVWEGEYWYSNEFPAAPVTWVFLSTDKLQWTGSDYSDVYDYTIEGKIISLNEYYTNSWVMTKCTPLELELVSYGSLGTDILKLKRQFYKD